MVFAIAFFVNSATSKPDKRQSACPSGFELDTFSCFE